MLWGTKHLILARLYGWNSVTNESKTFGHINGVAILSGQAQISWLEGPMMTNTLYIAFAFLEQLLSLINSRNVDIAYSNWKFSFHTQNTAKKSQQVHFMCTVV